MDCLYGLQSHWTWLFFCAFSIKPQRHNQWSFCWTLRHVNTLVNLTEAPLIYKNSWRFEAFVQKILLCPLSFLFSAFCLSFIIYCFLILVLSSLTVDQLTGISFIVHFLAHIAAVTIDPADASVRAKQSYSSPLPLFDRSKQPHVIHDLHCYLCDVKVYVLESLIQVNLIQVYLCSKENVLTVVTMLKKNLHVAAPKWNTAACATSAWKTLITIVNGWTPVWEGETTGKLQLLMFFLFF